MWKLSPSEELVSAVENDDYDFFATCDDRCLRVKNLKAGMARAMYRGNDEMFDFLISLGGDPSLCLDFVDHVGNTNIKATIKSDPRVVEPPVEQKLLRFKTRHAKLRV